MRGWRLTSAGVPAWTTPPVLDDDDPVGQRHRVDRVVGDQHGAAGELGQVPAQLGAHGEPGAGVERRQRLVEQQQRAGRRRARGPAPPAAPARRRAGPGAGRPRPSSPTRSSHAPAAVRASALPDAARAQPERHVLGDREVREEQVVLEHHAERAAGARARASPSSSQTVVPSTDDRPAVRRRAVRRAPAAAWTCPAPFGPRTASTSPSADLELDVERQATPAGRRRAPTGSCDRRRRPAEPAVAQQEQRRQRDDQQDQRQGDRRLRVVAAAPGRRRAASSASSPGSCRRR